MQRHDPLLDAATLASEHPEEIPFGPGKAGCSAVGLIIVILIVAGFWALTNGTGGGPSGGPSPTATPMDHGSLPPPLPSYPSNVESRP